MQFWKKKEVKKPGLYLRCVCNKRMFTCVLQACTTPRCTQPPTCFSRTSATAVGPTSVHIVLTSMLPRWWKEPSLCWPLLQDSCSSVSRWGLETDNVCMRVNQNLFLCITVGPVVSDHPLEKTILSLFLFFNFFFSTVQFNIISYVFRKIQSLCALPHLSEISLWNRSSVCLTVSPSHLFGADHPLLPCIHASP